MDWKYIQYQLRLLKKAALSRRHALQQRRLVVLRLVDARAHRPALHALRGIGPHETHELPGFPVRRIEPLRVILRRYDHRHAVMDRLHQRVGRGGDERNAVHAVPQRRDARQAEERRIARAQVPGMLLAGNGLPLVEAARGYEAAPLAKRIAKRRPLGDRLAARIRELVADRRVLRPMRNQSPAVLACAFARDDQDVGARTDVVARLELRGLVAPELQRDDVRIRMERVTATHNAEVTMAFG